MYYQELSINDIWQTFMQNQLLEHDVVRNVHLAMNKIWCVIILRIKSDEILKL